MRAPTLMVAALLNIALVTHASFAADAVVGSISSLSGTVEIDAFAKAAFIPAVRGDKLYEATVLRTGPQGRASIELLGKPVEVPPGSLYKVAEAIVGQRRSSRLGWFPALLAVLKETVASFGTSGSDVVLGSRAHPVGEEDDGWIVEEDDPGQLLLDARRQVREGSWMDALATLDAIGAGDTLPPGETLFLRGSAQFGLGDYATARLHLARAEPLVKTSADPGAADILPILLFQLGVSRYLVGEDGPAVESLAAFIALDPDSPFAAGGYQLLLRALVAQGERSRAERVLAEAQGRFAGTAHEKEFATLPPAP
jgi:hypothetical protein